MTNQNILLQLLWQEEKVMKAFLLHLTSENPTNEAFNELDLVNYNLLRKDGYNAMELAHRWFLQQIFNTVFQSFFQKENPFLLYQYSFEPNEVFDFQEIIKKEQSKIFEIIENLHINFLNSEFSYQQGKLKRIKSKLNLKETGSVYTQKDIAKEITEQTIENYINQGNEVDKIKILDFGCGTGRFLWSAFDILEQKYQLDKTQIIKQLYAVDINNIAIAIVKLGLLLKTGIEYFELIDKQILHRNMLMIDNGLSFSENNYLNLQADFQEVITNEGFDVIVSNPPYFLLKINKNNTSDATYQKYFQYLTDKINLELSYFRNAGIYSHSIEGMLNYYKLSIEMMLRLAKPKGDIGIICPSTLFGDVSSSKLRKYILSKNKLRALSFLPENARLFENVAQATAIFYIGKQQKTEEIAVTFEEKTFNVNYDLIQSTFAENLEIPQMDEIGWDILKKLSKFKKLKEFKNLRNRRGEFDLLQFKHLITNEIGDFRLIRGNMINSVKIEYDKNNEFVKIDDFLKAKSQEFLAKDFQKIRLVCQQISNMDIAKRLKFVPCSPNDILGNSCNYISADDSKLLSNLQILLNTQVLNWRFKVTSTNNHINNYELDELPLIDFTSFSNQINGNEVKNNVEIAKMYGLNQFEIKYLLEKQFDKKEVESYL